MAFWTTRSTTECITYTLLAAWARSGTKCAYRKTEALLNQMWKDYEAGNIHFRPDSSSYNTVINAISKSQAEGKAQKALRMLRKMDKLYRAGRNEDACPNEFSYTSVLNSCAFAVEVDVRGRSRALDTAIFTLKELKNSHYGDPNHFKQIAGTIKWRLNNKAPSVRMKAHE